MGTLLDLSSTVSIAYLYLFLFSITISIMIGLVIVKYLDRKNKLIKLNRQLIPTIITVSIGIEIVMAMYLLLFDGNLFQYAVLHWFALLLLTLLNIIVLEAYLMSNDHEIFYFVAAVGFMGLFGMLLNAALNLQFSQFAGAIGGTQGLQYLFGFGVVNGSTFGVSFSFTILLIFSAVTFSAGLINSMKKNRK
ncbi:MAG: hypothetical protein M1348_02980 [Candidatus Parvarchaeota archaeon]|jgi:hypothetical protein|nr:hypothetical protein [Candidatus Parvarchaeota archaeon]MCL5101549.1 hypothetical protein [Candidatus Parvarchaeota archaeon]